MRQTGTRLRACDFCRAHRLGCDRVKRDPEPCSTCVDRELRCTFTIPASSGNGVRHRRKARRTRDFSSQSTQALETSERNGHQAPAILHSPDQPPSVDFQLADIDEYHGVAQQVDDVLVSPAVITDSFRFFFQSMHHHFPFLDPATFSIARSLEVSPLLFWTIIAIANNFQNRSLYRKLQPVVRRLVADVLYPSGHGLETCQALCLLCLWPLEGQDPNDEPVFLYAGMLTHLAMRTGLHRAEWQHEYKNINMLRGPNERHSFRDMVHTWAACVFVEHHHACKNGLPSGIRPDWPMTLRLHSPSSSRSSAAISPTIKHILMICLIQDRYLNALSYDGKTPSGRLPPKERLGHIKLFSAALDDFQAANPHLETQGAIFLQFARVVVGGLCLARDLQTNLILREECSAIIITGIHAAVAILDLMAPLPWEAVPQHMLRAVMYAGVFAAQLLRLRSRARFETVGDLVAILRRALEIMRHLAYGHDYPTRCKVVLETEMKRHTALQTHHGAVESEVAQSEGLGVEFQTRMGAGIYWDLLEFDKLRHNWDQDAEIIYKELLGSGFEQI